MIFSENRHPLFRIMLKTGPLNVRAHAETHMARAFTNSLLKR